MGRIRQFGLGAAFALTGLGSMPHAAEAQPMVAPTPVYGEAHPDAAYLTEPISPPQIETISITIQVPNDEQEHRTGCVVKGAGFYAKEFADDDAAHQVDTVKADAAVDIINELHDKDWDHIEVDVIGNASGEDETNNPLGGGDTESEDNQKLADTRGPSGAAYIQSPGKLPSEVVVNVPRGVEHHFTRQEIKDLWDKALEHGHEDPNHLIDHYNDGKPVTPDVAQLLYNVLDRHRITEYVIRARKAVVVTNPSTEEHVHGEAATHSQSPAVSKSGSQLALAAYKSSGPSWQVPTSAVRVSKHHLGRSTESLYGWNARPIWRRDFLDEAVTKRMASEATPHYTAEDIAQPDTKRPAWRRARAAGSMVLGTVLRVSATGVSF